MDRSRRGFLTTDCFSQALKLVNTVQKSFQEAKADTAYFDSYETCYPLISEYSYFLDDEVEDLKLNTKGKSNLEIVETIYEKKGKSH